MQKNSNGKSISEGPFQVCHVMIAVLAEFFGLVHSSGIFHGQNLQALAIESHTIMLIFQIQQSIICQYI